jgi:hypothetical protein
LCFPFESSPTFFPFITVRFLFGTLGYHGLVNGGAKDKSSKFVENKVGVIVLACIDFD